MLYIVKYYIMTPEEYSQKETEINNVSDIYKVLLNLKKYCDKLNIPLIQLYVSDRKNKKFMLKNPYNNKTIHFGDIRYKDFTKHNDNKKRLAYLTRATKIKGDWINDNFSPNNLSIHLLWKETEINNVSDNYKILLNLKKYCNKLNIPLIQLYVSNRKNKKFMLKNPYNNKTIHFGDIHYKDFTKHNDNKRLSYLTRATKIRGNWKNDPLSANNLSINILGD